MVVSDTLYIAYFGEIRFSREMDRDCCWDTRGGTQTAEETRASPWICVRGTEITGCVLSVLDSFTGELAALIIPRVATLEKVWLR